MATFLFKSALAVSGLMLIGGCFDSISDGGACLTNDNCVGNESCIDGACAIQCFSAEDCNSGETCSFNRCESTAFRYPDVAPAPTMVEDASIDANTTAHDGALNDAVIPELDSSIMDATPLMPDSESPDTEVPSSDADVNPDML
ncbi:MAG: EB domain-containing protein [Bradymonadia bacterium]